MIHPFSVSLTALCYTVRSDFTWNVEIAGAFGLTAERSPWTIVSHHSAGHVRPALAGRLGLKKQLPVIIGGDGPALAAYSAGIREPGQGLRVVPGRIPFRDDGRGLLAALDVRLDRDSGVSRAGTAIAPGLASVLRSFEKGTLE